MNRPWDSLSPHERARRIRGYLAANHAACPRCGYDLFGLAVPDCPECGNTVDERGFSFLAPEGDERYETRRVQEYVATNRTTCPGCQMALDRVNGRACPFCEKVLEVWMLMPRGLAVRRRGRWAWPLLLALLYFVLAALVGVLGLWTRPG